MLEFAFYAGTLALFSKQFQPPLWKHNIFIQLFIGIWHYLYSQGKPSVLQIFHRILFSHWQMSVTDEKRMYVHIVVFSLKITSAHWLSKEI